MSRQLLRRYVVDYPVSRLEFYIVLGICLVLALV